MSDDNLGEHVSGPIIELAAKAKKALEVTDLLVETSYGNFYVGSVELRYYHEGLGEVVGYLRPDEADGKTYDFWTSKDPQTTE